MQSDKTKKTNKKEETDGGGPFVFSFGSIFFSL